jgi:hypothetical protein
MFVIDPYILRSAAGTTGLGLTPYRSALAQSANLASLDFSGEGGSAVFTASESFPMAWRVIGYIGGNSAGGGNIFSVSGDVYQEFKLIHTTHTPSMMLGICNESINNSEYVGSNTAGIGWYGGYIGSGNTAIYYNSSTTDTILDSPGSMTLGDRCSVRLQLVGGNYIVTGYINGVQKSHGVRPALSGGSYLAICTWGPSVVLQATRASEVRHPISGSVYLG